MQTHIFYHRCFNPAIRANLGIADDGVGADHAVLTDMALALNIGVGPDDRILPDEDFLIDKNAAVAFSLLFFILTAVSSFSGTFLEWKHNYQNS